MTNPISSPSRLRLIELLASLSLATDLGTGQPLGHALSTSLLAVDLAGELGCDGDEIRSVQQVALLRYLGCTSDATETAVIAGGDDMAFNATMATALFGGAVESLTAMVDAVGPGLPVRRRAGLLASVLTDPKATRRALTAHCEVASMLARRLALADGVVHALAHGYERWDGKGYPIGLRGDAIPLETRIAVVARDADLFFRNGDDVAARLASRRGAAYDPDVVDAYARLRAHPVDDWDRVLEVEPWPFEHVADLDGALGVIADFADLKSAWTRGHSREVAALVHPAAGVAGLDAAEARGLERAALVHDIGRVGIENGIWDKPGPLTTAESERVKLHPYLTQRILARCTALAPIAELASSHHERLDGSGYHRQSSADAQSPEVRLLAAADELAALTAPRPHRPAMTTDRAFAVLGEAVRSGRLDRHAVACLEAAVAGTNAPRHINPVGLTDREIDVLKEIAAGHTNRQTAERLFISPKTVGRHIENIYLKIGVSTRAGAAVYAMEHRLI